MQKKELRDVTTFLSYNSSQHRDRYHRQVVYRPTGSRDTVTLVRHCIVCDSLRAGLLAYRNLKCNFKGAYGTGRFPGVLAQCKAQAYLHLSELILETFSIFFG